MSSKHVLIIQTSPPHTGSTFLANLLYGYIHETKPLKGFYLTDISYEVNNIVQLKKESNVSVLKSHVLNIDFIINNLSKEFDVYIVSSSRGNNAIEKKYYEYKNVLNFSYDELLESPQNNLEKIVDNCYNKLLHFLPSEVTLDKEAGLRRITNMNKRYEEIKHLPFTYVDTFYELHGSHRNRNN
jgi:hypothetical protein